MLYLSFHKLLNIKRNTVSFVFEPTQLSTATDSSMPAVFHSVVRSKRKKYKTNIEGSVSSLVYTVLCIALCQTPASQTHPHWFQNQSVTGPLYLVAQSGLRATGNHPEKKESYQQCPPTPYAWISKHLPFCEGRIESSETICKSGSNPPGHNLGLENESCPRIRNSFFPVTRDLYN